MVELACSTHCMSWYLLKRELLDVQVRSIAGVIKETMKYLEPKASMPKSKKGTYRDGGMMPRETDIWL